MSSTVVAREVFCTAVDRVLNLFERHTGALFQLIVRLAPYPRFDWIAGLARVRHVRRRVFEWQQPKRALLFRDARAIPCGVRVRFLATEAP